jgi:chitodextrinase
VRELRAARSARLLGVLAQASAGVLVAAVLIFGTGTGRAATPGLVAAFAFDEGSGATVADSSGNGNSGTVSGTSWTPSGKYGSALVFNGTSARVTVADAASLHLSTAMTLEAWVNPSSNTPAWRDVIYKGDDNYYLEGTSTNGGAPATGGRIGSGGGFTAAPSALPTGTWSHLAATYDGTTLRLYVNGTQVASQARTGAIVSSTNPLQIGGDGIYGQFFQGTIDEVRVYNTALTAAQVQADMAAPISNDTQAPTAPGNLTANAVSGTQINLTWNASTDNVGVSNYLIERCQGAGCSNFTQVGTATQASYSDTGLTATTTYSYRVRAADASGNRSAYSNTATTTTPTPDTQPPTTPTNLSATSPNPGELDLTWTASTDNTSVTNYLVERCLGASCSNFVQVGTPAGPSFVDTGLASATTYSYRVRATDGSGNLSGYSIVATGTTKAGATGLVASYGFDEGSGAFTNDGSGNGNRGTVSGATWTPSGKYGSALVFNGTSAWVSVLDAPSLRLSTAMTLEAWVNPASNSSTWRDVIYKGDDNYYLEGTSTNGGAPATGGRIGSGGGFTAGPSALPTGTWSHVAATYDGTTLRLYVNGAQVASQPRSGTITGSPNPLQIGGDSLYGQYFQGTIDEVRVYSTALTAAQIQADMATPITNDTQPPTAPGNLQANAAGTQVALTWNASTDNTGVSTYLIERCQGTGCSNFTQVATASQTNYTDTGLTASTTYSYRVRAVDAAGNQGPYSNIATATTPTPDTQPPSAPTNLTPTSPNAGEVDLTWTASTDNTGVTGYQVERCQGTGCSNFIQIAVTGGSVTSWADLGLTPGTTYLYRVRAFDASGNESAYSATATATTAQDTTPPSAPGTLTATTASTTQINLSWGPATDDVGVTQYRVDRCQGVGCSNFSHRFQSETPVLTYSDTGLTPGTSYSYQVRALDAAGNQGPVSNTATAVTTAAASTLVASYSFDENTGSTVTDSSGNGNTGTISGATWTASGRFGPALVFNGTNAKVTIPDATSLHLSTGMTLEAWVKPSAQNFIWSDAIYKGDDKYYLEGTSPSGPPAGAATTAGGHVTALGSSSLPLNAWSFITATYDGTAIRLYVNGSLASTAAASGAIQSSTNPLQIGGNSLYSQYFQGAIDEVRVYNAPLTANQIQADMAIGINYPSATSGLTATAVSQSEVDLSWLPATDRIGVTGYRLERCQGAACTNFTQIATPAGTTYNDTGLAANTTYTYRVRAVNTGGNAGDYSNTSSAFTGLVVSPRTATLTFTRTQQFIAQGGAVTWSVDGVTGGSSTAGTITTGGLYTPPATVGTHTVTATAGGQSVNATVYITNYPGIFTFHNDNSRLGANTNETVLTPANVNTSTFGRLFSYPLDGTAVSSPLYVPNLSIPGQGFHNVVFIATEHDSVYAFDADGRSNTPLWQDSFINPGAGVTTVLAGDTGECCDIQPEIGITSTPVIDPATNTMYVVAKTKEVSGQTTTYVQRLHALDLTTGAEKFGGPVVIQASVPGTGVGASGGVLPFSPLHENQRAGLLLLNGVVYMAFGSHGDIEPYHGWVLGYDATTLQQKYVWCATPDGEGAGIWQSGDGLASDGSFVYLTTGDGTFDADSGGRDYGDSYVKLNPNLTVADWFTPADQNIFNNGNVDLGAGGLMLLPPQPGLFPNLLTSAGKPGTVDLVNRDNMGHYNPSGDTQIVQSLKNVFPNGSPEPGNYSAPVYLNGDVFWSPVTDVLQDFRLTNGRFGTTPVLRSAVSYGYPGGSMSASANGSSNGILWAVQRNDVTAPGVLYAYDPSGSGSTLPVLYSSSLAGTRDTLDIGSKFTIPTVANGRVYVASVNQLAVYGLLP